MPRLDWYAFYVADYRADTRHLTPMQHFAYREIIDEIFLSGQHEYPPHVPDDDGFLIALCRPNSPEEWQQTRHVLIDGPRALLKAESGIITQKRVTHEVQKALERAFKAKKAASGRWRDGGDGENGVAVPKNGGNGHMSDSQYAFLASAIGKWKSENSWQWAGATDDSAFERAFMAQFGMKWQKWQAEVEKHAQSDA